MSDKTPFEQWMKDSLESYQAPYDPSGWEEIEKELDGKGGPDQTPRSSSKMKRVKIWSAWAAGAAALIVGGALLVPEKKDSQVQERSNPSSSEIDPEVRSKKEEKHLSEGEKEHSSTDETLNGSEKTGRTGSGTTTDNGSPNDPKPSDRPEKETVGGDGQEEAEKALTDLHKEKKQEKNINKKTSKEKASAASRNEDQKEELPSRLVFLANQQEGCPPLKVSFNTPDPEPEGVDYFWDFGNGRYSNKAEPTHRYEEAGDYDVTLTLTDRSTGKTMSLTKENLITVNRSPKGRIVEVEERGLRKPRPISAFRIKEAENLKNIVWQLGDGTQAEGQKRVEHRYSSKGTYSVNAVISGKAGCKDTLQHFYQQKKSYDLLAPDAFSPDGDGRNDHFIPEALKILDLPFTMTIHDRSGKVVYKTNSAGDPWSGRVQNNGETMDAGSTFLWVVVLENEKGEEESYKGHVTIVK